MARIGKPQRLSTGTVSRITAATVVTGPSRPLNLKYLEIWRRKNVRSIQLQVRKVVMNYQL